MEIIDAQIHEVNPFKQWSPSFSPEQAIETSAELAVAAMDATGVTAAIVNSTLPTVKGYLDRFPDRFGGLPFAGPQLQLDGSVDNFIADIKAASGMVGVRMIIGYPLDGSNADRFRNGEYEPYFVAAERHKLPVFVLMHGYLPELHGMLRAHPGLIVVIDHLGLFHPPWKSGLELFDDIPAVVDLAQFPNVAVKITGAPHLSERPYPFEDLWPHLHKIINAFGVDRLMWGSDFTRCRGHHSYRESVEFLLYADEVSATDKESLFSGSIRRWLGWPEN